MDDLRQKYLDAIAGAGDEAALEDLRVQAVGKKGEISLKMRELGKMTPEERQVAGPKLNALKDEINSALAAKKVALEDAALDARLAEEWLDVTLPGAAAQYPVTTPEHARAVVDRYRKDLIGSTPPDPANEDNVQNSMIFSAFSKNVCASFSFRSACRRSGIDARRSAWFGPVTSRWIGSNVSPGSLMFVTSTRAYRASSFGAPDFLLSSHTAFAVASE